MMTNQPFTVHEGEIAVYHAWGDGLPVSGPLLRHLQPAIQEEFRDGMKISQAGDVAEAAGFSEWRRYAPVQVMDAGWLVELSLPFGATQDVGGVQISDVVKPGTPVVLVVRFLCRDTGLWRVFQFHDCVVLAGDAADDAQRMFRTVRFSAGHMEQFKSGLMPGMEPRMRGVIEWRHLGRTVKCWEYDPEADVWAEDAENLADVDGEAARYVSLDFDAEGLVFSYMAPKTMPGVRAGLNVTRVGWIDAITLAITASSGLTLAPGWTLETEGCAEPLLLRPHGRHWESSRVVFRMLGRVYATIDGGVFALPALTEGVPDAPLDLPIRLGRLVLYPDGGFVI